MLDVFNKDAFGVISLTMAIDKLPFQPSRIGSLGLFSKAPQTTRSIMVEERHGTLSIVREAAYGSQPNVVSGEPRLAKSFRIPHFPQFSTLLAEDVQDVRAFGSEDNTEAVAAVVNDRLTKMKQNHEITWEYHRSGALQGIVYDATGAVIYNFFTEFGITETDIGFNFAADAQDAKLFCMAVTRAMEDALGGTSYTKLHCMAGNDWFDSFITHPDVKEAYDRYQDSAFFRDTQRGKDGIGGGFEYCGITFENYRGKIDGTPFIPDDVARFFPTNAGDIFQEANAPADFMETVNTRGLPLYAKQERMPFDKGVQLHTQSNTLMLPGRPACLIKSTGTNTVTFSIEGLQAAAAVVQTKKPEGKTPEGKKSEGK